MTPRVERPLTVGEMAGVLTAITDAESVSDALVGAVFGVFDLLLGDVGESTDDYTEERPLDGRNLRIPSEQWHRIGVALQERARADGGDGVGVLLNWMNVGPSGCDPA